MRADPVHFWIAILNSSICQAGFLKGAEFPLQLIRPESPPRNPANHLNTFLSNKES